MCWALRRLYLLFGGFGSTKTLNHCVFSPFEVYMNLAFCHTVRLKFKQISSVDESLVMACLGQLEYVDRIHFESKKSIISFRYDASQLELDIVIDVLDALGIRLYRDSYWWRCKLAFVYYLERNIRSNARHVPHCCGKPPNGLRR